MASVVVPFVATPSVVMPSAAMSFVVTPSAVMPSGLSFEPHSNMGSLLLVEQQMMSWVGIQA